MNKSKIDWCDYTWNPVTGCLHGCEYCYARNIDKRFGDGKFMPTFHVKRIYEPLKTKKPSKIFVGSVSDLFGDWDWKDDLGFLMTRREVMNRILEVVRLCPQHTFIFLTKNPKGMQGINFPNNCWCGTSVENQEKADERIAELMKVDCKTLFVSYEPALGRMFFDQIKTDCKAITVDCFTGIPYDWDYGEQQPDNRINPINWLIIGAQTGRGAVSPNPEWLESAIMQCRMANIPIFVKDNCKWPEQIREFPQ